MILIRALVQDFIIFESYLRDDDIAGYNGKKSNWLKTKFRSCLMSIFDRIENNNNCIFETNGERFFLERLFTNFSKDKNKTRIIFDVGANIGNYTQMLLEYAEFYELSIVIHVFEPTIRCFNILEDKFKIHDNVFLIKKRLSNIEKRRFIYYDSESSGLASLYKRNLKHYNIEFSRSEEIETICAKKIH